MGPLYLVLVVLLVDPNSPFVPDVTPWTVVALLIGTAVIQIAAVLLWPHPRSTAAIVARLGLHTTSLGVALYAIGWGPALALALLIDIPAVIHTNGKRAVRAALFWVVTVLSAGQAAIALGWVPSVLHERLAHTLALLVGIGLVTAIVRVGKADSERARAAEDLRVNEDRQRALVQHATDIVLATKADGSIRYVSPAFERVLGYHPDEAVGMRSVDLVHPDDVDKVHAAFLSLPDREGRSSTNIEARMRDRNGEWLTFEAQLSNLLDTPSVESGIVNLHDISERVRAEHELRDAEEAFRSAFENAPIGMGLASNDGVLFRVNHALITMFGYTEEELLGTRFAELAHPDDEAVARRIREHLADEEFGRFKGEQQRYRHADGHYLWCSVSVSRVRAPDGTSMYQIGQIEDVSEQRAMADRLEHAAIHDPLTGLPNRVLFYDRLSHALGQTDRLDTAIGVILIDLDHFKFVNDSLGHGAGDALLRVLGTRMQNVVRPGDTVARIGGDEFVVLCDDVHESNDVFDVAERIAATIAKPVVFGEREMFITASIGVAVCQTRDVTPESMLRDADSAMYDAKDEGRARIEVFGASTRRRSVEHLETGADLHRALERSEFEVHYQPVVALETGRVKGFEALVRWNHPVRGMLLPDEFIDVAEESGLIVPIGAWVLEEACRQVVEWQTRRSGDEPVTIAINLAPRQLTEPTLASDVRKILEHTGIDPDTVWLELTEGSLMRSAESSTQALQALRDLGVHLSVDDFGTGYSSLAHLKRFPVEILKVDQSFIDGLGTDPNDTSIVLAIVTLAHSLGLEAVAEGLETPQQLSELRMLGCDYAQGFFFGQPKPASALGNRPADDLSAWHDHPAAAHSSGRA